MKLLKLFPLVLFLLSIPVAIAEDISINVNVVPPPPFSVVAMDIIKITTGFSIIIFAIKSFLMSPKTPEEIIMTMLIIIIMVLVLAWFFMV